MKKIKVAHIITRMDWGGSPDIVRILCRQLRRDNYEVALIIGPTLHPTKVTEEFLRDFKDATYLVPWLGRDISPRGDCRALFRLREILAGRRFDIVHTHTAKAGALGRVAARLAGCRRVVHMPHGNNFYGYFNPLASRLIVLIERALSAITTEFIVLSELEKKDLIDFGVASPGAIAVVPSGLEESEGDPADAAATTTKAQEKKRECGLGGARTVVGMLSRLEPVKGCGYFIEAAALVLPRFPDAAFVVVGDGSMRPALEKKARASGSGDRIIFTGWRNDALEIMSFVDIVVQPSLNEAIGRVLLEAQARGIPVVATNVGGIPEVVRDTVTGRLVPPRDPRALASAIGELLEDEHVRRAMGERARAWIDQKFSAGRMVAQVEKVYEELMGQ